MKHFVLSLVVIGLLAGNAAAAPISYATVGSVDILVGGFNLANSADATENLVLLNYLASQGYDTSSMVYTKVDINGEDSFDEVIGEPSGNLWSIDFAHYGIVNPAAFLVRFGNAVYTHYLYSNVGSMQYGVVNLSGITARRGTISIESISHSAAAGAVQQVPEPASVTLMLLGLASAGLAARRRKA